MEISEITYLVIFGTIAFLLFIVFIALVVVRHYKKSKEHIEETLRLKQKYEQNLLETQLEIQEQTFNAISLEIHDNVGQLLSLAKVQLSISEQQEIPDKQLLTDVKTNITSALTHLRNIAKSLNSDRIRQLTIAQIIDEELYRINKFGFITTKLTTYGDEREISEQKKAIAFRAVQECLQNILKHAEATLINVDIYYLPQEIKIVITDNGKGFDIEQAILNAGGMGLNNIKSRVQLIGGTVYIKTEVDNGTNITLVFPYE